MQSRRTKRGVRWCKARKGSMPSARRRQRPKRVRGPTSGCTPFASMSLWRFATYLRANSGPLLHGHLVRRGRSCDALRFCGSRSPPLHLEAEHCRASGRPGHEDVGEPAYGEREVRTHRWVRRERARRGGRPAGRRSLAAGLGAPDRGRDPRRRRAGVRPDTTRPECLIPWAEAGDSLKKVREGGHG